MKEFNEKLKKERKALYKDFIKQKKASYAPNALPATMTENRKLLTYQGRPMGQLDRDITEELAMLVMMAINCHVAYEQLMAELGKLCKKKPENLLDECKKLVKASKQVEEIVFTNLNAEKLEAAMEENSVFDYDRDYCANAHKKMNKRWYRRFLPWVD